jgi:hypothetical protein
MHVLCKFVYSVCMYALSLQGVVNGYTSNSLPKDMLAPANQATRTRLRKFIQDELVGPSEGVEAGLDASARCVPVCVYVYFVIDSGCTREALRRRSMHLPGLYA